MVIECAGTVRSNLFIDSRSCNIAQRQQDVSTCLKDSNYQICLLINALQCNVLCFVGEKIAMTTPVTSKVEPSSSPMGESTYTRSFYIPYSVQEDALKPSSSDVFLQDAPQQTVCVR